MTVSAATRCLIVADDRGLAAVLAELLGQLPGVHAAGVAEPAELLAGRFPACEVLLACEPAGEPPGRLTARLAAACPGPGIVMVSDTATIDAYREALAGGARALVAGHPTRELLGAAIANAARGARPAALPSGRAVALCGAKGGVGTTALALALAVVSGATLVDLADGRSDLSDLLGRRPEGTIAGLAQLGLDLDGALDSITGTHPSGLQVLAGGGHDQLDLLPQGLSASIVRALRHGRPLTLVDTGRGLAPAAREAVAAADATLLVTTPDAQAAAAARAQLLALGRVGVDQTTVAVVVNRWSRRAELSVRSLERACGAHVAAVVPESADRMAEFANARLALDRWPGRRLREPLAALVRTPPVAA